MLVEIICVAVPFVPVCVTTERGSSALVAVLYNLTTRRPVLLDGNSTCAVMIHVPALMQSGDDVAGVAIPVL